MPKIERQSTTPARAATTPRTAEQTAVASQGTAERAPTAFHESAAQLQELAPRAAQLSTSAEPAALWGVEAPRRRPASIDREAFRRMTPEQRKAALEAVKAQRDEVAQQIQQRVESLDRRFDHARLKTRAAAMHTWQGQRARLAPADQQKLDAALAKSDLAQQRIDALTAKASALPKDPASKAAQADQRKQLASELRKARAEQSAAVHEATDLVEAAGLKTDLLANTEATIDPAAATAGKSLLDTIGELFDLNHFFDWGVQLTQHAHAELAQFDEQLERRVKVYEEEQLVRRQRLDVEGARKLVARLLGQREAL